MLYHVNMAPLKNNALAKGAVGKSFRFSKLSARLLDMLAEDEQRTNTGYLEWLLRQQAEAKGWDVKKLAEQIQEESAI